MKTILFVTGNAGKAATLQRHVPEGYAIERATLDVPEIQHDSVEEIVAEKARYAFARLKRPLVMQDSAFHIAALKGFPGPYIKYACDTLGPEGVLKLMEGVADRRAFFRQAIAYADEKGNITVFACDDDVYAGTIAKELGAEPPGHSWGVIWRIYQPAGADKPLSELTADEAHNLHTDYDTRSEWAKFAEWLAKNQ